MARPRTPVIDRLWARVQRGSADECWPWLGPARPDGYGEIRVAPGDKQLVHRVVNADAFGPIPDDVQIHHTCETKLCCNPAHHERLMIEEHSQLHRAQNFLKA